MSKVPHSGQHHGDVVFIGGVDDFLIAHRATGMDDRGDASRCCCVDTVAERKKGVGGHYRARHDQTFVGGLDAGYLGRLDPAHLSRANTDGLAMFAVDDGIRLDEFRHFPHEQ